jgi:hypothetical protein
MSVDTGPRKPYIDDGIPPSNPLAGISLPSLGADRGGVGVGVGGPGAGAGIFGMETRPSSGKTYTQIGLINDPETNDVMPLMGRRLNRDRWQYYTVSTNGLNLKIPVNINGRSGMNEYGCNELSSGDTVELDGMKRSGQVTLYSNSAFQYL